MGEVYRAHDSRLGRDVAIKILPREFADNPERLARFEREARVLASLNHPNIAAIYGLEETGPADALGHLRLPAIVMELVEGQTLATRLAAGATRRPSGSWSVDAAKGLTFRQCITVAHQLVDALDAAHERGIIHRDLKPANIIVTPDSVVKVLDFGLARAAVATNAPGSEHPTALTIDGTRPGVVMGTAAYMSPEQARGQEIDRRTDIWAFGCVLYEMFTARPAFERETITDTLAAIVDAEPEWARLPAETSPGVIALLKQCLEKEPKRRLRDIGDARPYLEQLPAADGKGAVLNSKRRRLAMFAGGLGLLAIVLAGAWSSFRANQVPDAWWSHSAIRFPVDPIGYPDPEQTPIALSSDGSQLAWVAARDGKATTLWIQALAGGSPREVPGTEGASGPFWSPDGVHIGFFTDTKLNTVDVRSGLVTTVAEQNSVVSGGTWGADGTIVYSARYAILRVPASGGTATPVAVLNPQFHENSLRYPHFLPDGRHFVYVARSGRPQESAAYVGSLDATPRRLFATATEVSYGAPGYLIYGRDNVLVARRFNAQTFELGSEVATIAPYRAGQTTGMDGNFAVAGGVLAYFQEPTLPPSELWWLDRSGRPLEQLVSPIPGPVGNFRISPDGTKVVVDVASTTSTGRSVWVLAGKDNAPERVTFEASDDWTPVWSYDGRSVFFLSYRNGVSDLFEKSLTSGEEKAVLLSDVQKTPLDSSPDGKHLAYGLNTREGSDILALPLPAGSPVQIAATKGRELVARFSPDSRFVAFLSDELGSFEIFVEPFPPTGRKWPITVDGGGPPKWSANGREIVFVRNNDGKLMSVPLKFEGDKPVPGKPVQLFEIDRSIVPLPTEMFDVVGNGDRFLVRRTGSRQRQPISVILNWPQLLETRTGAQARDSR
jgi:Tol biopolymer transport system component